MTDVLEINQLHKIYGRITALNKLDLSIPKGEVFGLLGPNGSGKTTTLGMILDVITPTSGSYSWFGNGELSENRLRIGAILEKPNFYPNFSAQKNLELVAKIKRVKSTERIEAVLQQVGLYERKDDSFKTYSLGMKQRLAIAAALLNEPEVLILDEPTNGLDPEGIAEIRQLILEISKSGKTIILASHLLDEVQKICSSFGVLKRGKLIHHGRVDADFSEDLVIKIGTGDLDSLVNLLSRHSAYLKHKNIKNGLEFTFTSSTSPIEISKLLSTNELYPTLFFPEKKSLEQQFLEILSDHA